VGHLPVGLGALVVAEERHALHAVVEHPPGGPQALRLLHLLGPRLARGLGRLRGRGRRFRRGAGGSRGRSGRLVSRLAQLTPVQDTFRHRRTTFVRGPSRSSRLRPPVTQMRKSSTSKRGSVTTNVLPWPRAESTVSSPPLCSTSSLTTARPTPRTPARTGAAR